MVEKTLEAFEKAQMEAQKNWRQLVAKYQNPITMRSVWELITSVIPYFIGWALIITSLQFPYWITFLLIIPTAGFMIRLFIIFHDTGHGSFFRSQKSNDFWGIITGFLTFTPYYQWRHEHAVHHAGAGDLERRGMGDIWTVTVKEYQAMSFWQKLSYRAYRHPFVLFVIGPSWTFLIGHRFARKGASRRERVNVTITNLVMAAMLLTLINAIGLPAFLITLLPVVAIGGAGGIWMFYVQHQFEGTYWAHHDAWDYFTACLQGSSYYKLPAILQWFSGNIGLHHIHHLSPRIPNYRLQECHDENPVFQIKPVTFFSSLKSLTYRLWDEQTRRLVGFDYVKKMAQTSTPSNSKA
jgi:omega-6 fatty acid desaturase (delta-12 desaturase)